MFITLITPIRMPMSSAKRRRLRYWSASECHSHWGRRRQGGPTPALSHCPCPCLGAEWRRATCASSLGKSDHGLLRQRFESSHLTGCYHRDKSRAWVRRSTPPKMHEPTLAFAHFRFTADGARSLESKRAAYARAAAQWRNAHGGDAAPPADAPLRDRLQYANMNHAQKAYRAMQLLYKRDGDTLVFRDEVQVVTHVDCYGDRPLAPADATTGSTRPPQAQGNAKNSSTSG